MLADHETMTNHIFLRLIKMKNSEEQKYDLTSSQTINLTYFVNSLAKDVNDREA